MAPRAAARLESLGFLDVYEYRDGKHDWMAAGLRVEGENSTRPRAADIARKDLPVCRLGDRVGAVRESVRRSRADSAVVLDASDVVLGLLRPGDLSKGDDLRVEDAMAVGPSTFRPYVPVTEMADYMSKHDLESSPITTSDGKLVGVIYRTDAVREAEPHKPRG